MAVTDGDCIYKRVGLVLGGLSKRVAYQRLKSTHTHREREGISHEEAVNYTDSKQGDRSSQPAYALARGKRNLWLQRTGRAHDREYKCAQPTGTTWPWLHFEKRG